MNELPLPELHARVMSAEYDYNSGSRPHNDFYSLLATYRNKTTPDHFQELATTCDRRLLREAGRLPLDLVDAYGRLARLARWRAKQLEEEKQ